VELDADVGFFGGEDGRVDHGRNAAGVVTANLPL
jgi:hypothetical protein